jgi:TPR repeat protein
MRCFLFVLLFGCTIAAHAQDPGQYQREAKECFDKGDYDCAITKYKAYAVLSGQSANAEIAKAERCRDIKQSADEYLNRDNEKACSEYAKLLAENPRDAYAKQQKEKSCSVKPPILETEPKKDPEKEKEPEKKEAITLVTLPAKAETEAKAEMEAEEETLVTDEIDPFQLGIESLQKKDYKEAAEWFQKSAERGNAKAKNNLGLMYEKGLGVKKNEREAAKWYRKAAEQDFAIAQYNLGLMYEFGLGVKEDLKEAERWYKRSANQGNEEARNKLNNK